MRQSRIRGNHDERANSSPGFRSVPIGASSCGGGDMVALSKAKEEKKGFHIRTGKKGKIKPLSEIFLFSLDFPTLLLSLLSQGGTDLHGVGERGCGGLSSSLRISEKIIIQVSSLTYEKEKKGTSTSSKREKKQQHETRALPKNEKKE